MTSTRGPHLQRFFPTLAACDIDGPTVRAVRGRGPRPVQQLVRRFPGRRPQVPAVPAIGRGTATTARPIRSRRQVAARQ